MKNLPHRIIHGDALEVLKTFKSESIDMIFTDPPYNENYKYRNSGYKDYREDYYEYLEAVLTECKRILKNTGSIYLKHSSRQIQQILPLMSKIFIFRNLIIWINNSQAHPAANYDSYYEPIYFCTKTDTYIFNKRAELRKEPPNYWSGEGKKFIGLLSNCWYDIKKECAGCLSPEGETQGNEKQHPCSMPIRLPQRAIRISSNRGGVVLDPFMGSGTTALACKIEERNYIGIEKEEAYIELAARRLHNEAGLL